MASAMPLEAAKDAALTPLKVNRSDFPGSLRDCFSALSVQFLEVFGCGPAFSGRKSLVTPTLIYQRKDR
jgi:hypothetical protein